MTILQLTAAVDSLSLNSAENVPVSSNSIWLWISIIEFFVILYLFFKLKGTRSNLAFNDVKKKDLKKSQKMDIDMDNLMKSINGSRDLYKSLLNKCHPDKFVNTDKQEVAEKIFQEISNNKRDFGKLNELKIRAEKELNINF